MMNNFAVTKKYIIRFLRRLRAKLFGYKPKGPVFHLEYVYSSDVKQQGLDQAAAIREDQRSEFIFEGETLYRQPGRGHSFVYGFFRSYVTKSGKQAEHFFTRDLWLIENEFYEWIDDKFVVLPRREFKPLDFSKPIPFPLIKSAIPELKSMELLSVQPMTNNEFNKEGSD